jgi:DNA-binding CsgD family transcriptional regulator
MDNKSPANRLTTEQRQRLQRRRLDFILGTAGLGLVGIGMLLLVGLVLSRQSIEAPLWLLIPLFGVWGWLLRNQPQQWRRANRDLSDGEVETLDGIVRGEVAHAPGFVRFSKYRLCIGERCFNVDQRSFFATPLGSRARLIYTPHAQVLVDTQPLGAYQPPTAHTTPSATNAPAALPEPLTERELELLKLIAAGHSNAEIGQQLALSTNTVKVYTSQLYRKLDVQRRTEAVARAKQLGILS